MRLLPFVLGILVATAGIGTSAQAQNYPWCAYYSGGRGGGGTNCGFTSFEQCQATVIGIGGFCECKHAIYRPCPRGRRAAPAQAAPFLGARRRRNSWSSQVTALPAASNWVKRWRAARRAVPTRQSRS